MIDSRLTHLIEVVVEVEKYSTLRTDTQIFDTMFQLSGGNRSSQSEGFVQRSEGSKVDHFGAGFLRSRW